MQPRQVADEETQVACTRIAWPGRRPGTLDVDILEKLQEVRAPRNTQQRNLERGARRVDQPLDVGLPRRPRPDNFQPQQVAVELERPVETADGYSGVIDGQRRRVSLRCGLHACSLERTHPHTLALNKVYGVGQKLEAIATSATQA